MCDLQHWFAEDIDAMTDAALLSAGRLGNSAVAAVAHFKAMVRKRPIWSRSEVVCALTVMGLTCQDVHYLCGLLLVGKSLGLISQEVRVEHS